MPESANRSAASVDRVTVARLGVTSRRSFVVGTSSAALVTLAACTNGGPQASEVDPGTKLGSVEDIPVGGGKLYLEGSIVVTQPTEGEFLGLSAICTHQQCTVREVNGDVIYCGCHGSEFDLEGNVVTGPATEPLPEMTIKVEHDEIFTA